MKSMWAQYIEEVFGNMQFIENEHGFISFALLDDAIYLKDIWVKPESRKTGAGLDLVNQAEAVGLAAGLTTSIATIDVAAKTFAVSLQAHLNVGFKPFMATENKIWLKRNASGE